jgi:homopolymeric O-antigen transport system permease protein
MTVAQKTEIGSQPRSGGANRLAAALADLILGLQQWRTWWVLAFHDIRQRYRRSTLGQFWLTISMAAMIGGIGLIYTLIFDQRAHVYVPYLGIGLIVWGLLASLVNDLSTCLINAETYLRSYPSPRSIVIYQTITRNFIISAHNFIIVPFLLIFFSVPITWTVLLALPGLLLIALNAVWIGMVVGPLCTRYRDLPPIFGNAVQLAFFLTPILYQPAQLEGRLWAVTHLNPFASFVEIVRGPLLNEVPAGHHYLMVATCTVVGWSVAILFYARFRGRIVYWL